MFNFNFGGFLNINKLNIYNIIENSVSIQSVRYRRKPRWLPVAKSKMFRVPERKILPIDEKLEIQRLYNNYRTQMRSVRTYFINENEQKKNITSADHIFTTPEQEDLEFNKIKELNDKWNLEISKIRNDRIAKENAEKQNLIMERLHLKELREDEAKKQIQAIVQKELENSKTFITRSNIDQALEECLANPKDYNFAIDRNGNMYRGKNADIGQISSNNEKI